MAPNDQTVEARLDELTARADDLDDELKGAILRIVEFVREEERLVRQRQSALARVRDGLRKLLE